MGGPNLLLSGYWLKMNESDQIRILQSQVDNLLQVIKDSAQTLYRIEVRRQGIGWDEYHTEKLVATQHALSSAYNENKKK